MCGASIIDWSKEEKAELAVPEHDPEYLPPGMGPPDSWFTASGHYFGATLILPAEDYSSTSQLDLSDVEGLVKGQR